VSAGVYYVDKLHPSASDSNDGLEDSPWLTIRHGCDQLSAGDTLYVKGDGSSIVKYVESASGRNYEHPCAYPSRSGTATDPITIAAYPGHERSVRIVAPGTNGARPIGSYGSDWIIWDGFRLKSNSANYNNGGAWIGGGAHHVTIRNCIFEGTTNITVNDNRQAIMIEDSNDFHIHDNLFQDWWSTSQNDMSNAAVRAYRINGGIIENNEFNDCNAGIDLKGQCNVESDTSVTYVRYNLFVDFVSQTSNANNRGIYGFHQTDPSPTNQVRHLRIYQNVFDNLHEGVTDGEGGAYDWDVYNNTFYDIRDGCTAWWGSSGTSNYTRWEVWNNIFILSSSSKWMLNGHGISVAGKDNVIHYWDYNCYHNSGSSWRINWTGRTHAWWQGEGYDTNDQTPGSNPLADPGNGNYKLSSYDGENACYGTGRGGQYAKTMGAYITGNEIIGPNFDKDVEPPESPTGVEILK
jgi:hypothetical protein